MKEERSTIPRLQSSPDYSLPQVSVLLERASGDKPHGLRDTPGICPPPLPLPSPTSPSASTGNRHQAFIITPGWWSVQKIFPRTSVDVLSDRLGYQAKHQYPCIETRSKPEPPPRWRRRLILCQLWSFHQRVVATIAQSFVISYRINLSLFINDEFN